MASPAPVLETRRGRPLERTERGGLAGYFMVGLMIAIPAILWPCWKYHLQPPYLEIGIHYLVMALGLVLGLKIPGWANRLEPMPWTRIAYCGLALACFGLGGVQAATGPAVRQGLFFVFGLALGILLENVAEQTEPLYEQNQAGTVNLSGGLFGLGVLAAAVGAGVFNALDGLQYFAPFAGMAALALGALPGQAGAIRSWQRRGEAHWGRSWRELQSPVHVLFAAILFFETASEFSVLEWSSLHLIVRCGISPAAGLWFLAFYAFCLLAGRYLAQAALRQYPGRRMLLVSALAAWTGLLIFETANNTVGAAVGLGFSAFGFSFVYPLLVERIGSRFQDYRYGEFRGIFGLAILGGMLAPGVIGIWASSDQESTAMSLPFWASFMVFLLLVFVWIESKINGLQASQS